MTRPAITSAWARSRESARPRSTRSLSIRTFMSLLSLRRKFYQEFFKTLDRRRSFPFRTLELVPFCRQLTSLGAYSSGEIGIEPSFAGDDTPVRRNCFLPFAPCFFSSFSGDSHKDTGGQWTRHVGFTSARQFFAKLDCGQQFAFRCLPDQRVYIERLGNQHFARPKAHLHLGRDVYDLRFLNALKLFAPCRSAGKF